MDLDTDARFVRGVGPARAVEFAKLGVCTVGDLVEYFPFRHELSPKSQPINSLELGAVSTIVGALERVRERGAFKSTSITAEVVDGTGRCRVRWFHSPFLVGKLHTGLIVRLTGKVDLYRDLASLTNPKLTVIDEEDDPLAEDMDRYGPVYAGTAALASQQIAKCVDSVLREVGGDIGDFLPDDLRKVRSLPPRRTAILRYHKPTSPDDVSVARRRLAYDEFLLCQLAVQMSRRRIASGPKARPIVTTDEIDRRIRSRFPFTLTPGQNRAIREIRDDLMRTVPMNRMLQADVGAGKTAVAVYAALTTVANGRQVALIAPTEVLAKQHHTKVSRYLEGSRVRVGHLVGSTTKKQRSALLDELREGRIDVLIGTHALLEEEVRFRDLGLSIVDEQHKFGVAQRAALRNKGRAPHTMVLTATPIPRTLAMTVFGDLDVSTIEGVLPNRRPVVTRLIASDKVASAWSFIRSRLEQGEQAYIVYPLVEESESLPLKAATVEVERLSSSTLSGYRVGLLHGKMKSKEKVETMRAFREGSIRALVSTTVIEVGVDVPGATVMAIQHAERYGLSQLHQLRGRIGRGSKESYCLLFTDRSGEEANERLSILCETNDGFRIAEEDLRLRGPGELLGTRQHGLPTFKVANVIDDFELLEQARDDAAQLLRDDCGLSAPRHADLRSELVRRYADTAGLIDVG